MAGCKHRHWEEGIFLCKLCLKNPNKLREAIAELRRLLDNHNRVANGLEAYAFLVEKEERKKEARRQRALKEQNKEADAAFKPQNLTLPL